MGSGSIFLGGSLEAAAYQSLAYHTPLRLGTDFSFSGRYNFFVCLFCCFIRGAAICLVCLHSKISLIESHIFRIFVQFIAYPSQSPVRVNRK